jgi:hypothetical protein
VVNLSTVQSTKSLPILEILKTEHMLRAAVRLVEYIGRYI